MDRGPLGQKAVFGAGEQPSQIMLIQDSPSWQEIRAGRSFVGETSQVLWDFFWKYAQLTHSDCYSTSLVKHQVEEDPTEEEIAHWHGDLVDEIFNTQPSYIVALGKLSTRALLGPDVDMNEAHGLPHPIAPVSGFQDITVIPAFHPQAGLHQTKQLTHTMLDLQAVGEIVRGRGPKLAVDEHPWPTYLEDDADFRHGAYVAIDTEGYVSDPWCLQFSLKPGEAGFIRATDKFELMMFRKWLKEEKPLVIFHHALHDLKVLQAMGINIDAMGLRYVDTMVMAFNTQILPQGLKPLARRLCGMQMSSYHDVVIAPYLRDLEKRGFEALSAETTIDAVCKNGKPRKTPLVHKSERGILLARALKLVTPADRLERLMGLLGAPAPKLNLSNPDHIHYACRDADATLRVYPKLVAILQRDEMIQLTKIDQGVLPMVSEMQRVGLTWDVKKLEALVGELRATAAEQLEICKLLADDEGFNPGSPPQVHEALYGKRLKLDNPDWRSNGTDADTLQMIVDAHPLVPAILEWRGTEKLLSSYGEKLLAMAPAGRDFFTYYPDFSVTKAGRDDTGATAVVSGRMAEWILTFPARTEIGRKIRSCAVAPPGWLMGSADLSQIELRILADESRDPELLQAYWDNADLHTRTASRMFQKPEDQVDKLTERYPMKETNFLVGYGGGAPTLYQKLLGKHVPGITLAKCEEYIRNWYQLYSGVRSYAAEQVGFGKQNGYVKDRWGRRRYLPALLLHGELGARKRSRLDSLRFEAERQALNHPIQSGAQGLMKRGQIRWWFQERPKLPKDVKVFLQVHDELLVLFRPEHEEQVREATLRAMTGDANLFVVPIISEWASAADWGSLK